VGDRWIMDGNYSGSLDIRLERADTVIILVFSRWRCLVRVLRRWWTNRGGGMCSPTAAANVLIGSFFDGYGDTQLTADRV
jgi:hypothetical protein